MQYAYHAMSVAPIYMLTLCDASAEGRRTDNHVEDTGQLVSEENGDLSKAIPSYAISRAGK
jgi:hypothetical protein